MWPGGMEAYIYRDVPVNLPPGSRASPVHMQGVFGMAGPLVSWERAMGFSPADILAGEEEWSVPEGTNLVVRRPDRPGHVRGAVRANSTG
ncbi:hypothetical protein BD311DRAFT_763729 [Dichomitus squalens]|uniref:Uncharacterized protein n=1 Tax=Dichomitus squalens TaxID=114155 RepID=A0A4Q9MIU5_9APHY|nr:hypothetical protein BD311DRAFT_763729 [Dichomitus squalens]